MRYLILLFLMCVLLCVLLCGSAQAQYFSTPPNTLLNYQLSDANTVMQNFNQIIADGNTTFNNFETQIAAIPGGGIPAKAIMPFNLVACPTGWVTADGTGGTPDMRGYFVKATGATIGVKTDTSTFIDHFHVVIGDFITGLQIVTYPSATGPKQVLSSLQSYTPILGLTSGGATETRPKNIALLFCMKS
jgi:hypothetical protein